jgi:hypothetical protein
MTIFSRSLSKETRGTGAAANQNSGAVASEAANDRPSTGEGRHMLAPANSSTQGPASVVLPARRMDLKPDDRDTFDRWVRWVAAFYSALAISLLGAMLLGTHTPATRNDLLASHAPARGVHALPAPAAWSGVK